MEKVGLLFGFSANIIWWLLKGRQPGDGYWRQTLSLEESLPEVEYIETAHC